MDNKCTLYITEDNYNTVFVQGEASFKISCHLKEYCLLQLQKNNIYESLILDLKNCSSMDSTFMGTIGMIYVQAKESGVSITIRNADTSNKKLLIDLGLGNILIFDNIDFEDTIKNTLDCSLDERTIQENILSAHECLIDIDQANTTRFKNVIDLLKKEL